MLWLFLALKNSHDFVQPTTVVENMAIPHTVVKVVPDLDQAGLDEGFPWLR